MIIHVTPIGDLKPHIDDTACGCNPSVNMVEGEQIVIHNSFNGREGLELANEVLGK